MAALLGLENVMTQNQRHDSTYSNLNLFPSEAVKTTTESASDTTRIHRLGQLALRYPLFLLGGIWLISVLIAVSAFGGLMDPGVDRSSQVTAPPTQQPSKSQNSKPSPSATDTDAPAGSAAASSTSAIAATAQSSAAELPGWSLLFLVGTCAAGCFVLSRLLQRPVSKSTAPQPRRSQRQPTPPKPPVPAAGPKRLKPFSVPLPETQPLAAPAQPSPQFTPPTQIAQSAPAQAAAGPSTYPASSVVTVLPEQEDHPLDWPEGSLAHQLDMRQQRSLSSFL